MVDLSLRREAPVWMSSFADDEKTSLSQKRAAKKEQNARPRVFTPFVRMPGDGWLLARGSTDQRFDPNSQQTHKKPIMSKFRTALVSFCAFLYVHKYTYEINVLLVACTASEHALV